MGAGIGGLVGGFSASLKGQRFIDGKSKVLTERYILGTGNTPEENYYYTKERISKLNEVSGNSTREWNANINKGFEGDLQINGWANPEKGETFFVKSDGKLLFQTKTRTPFSLKLSSSNKNVRWGISGRKINVRVATPDDLMEAVVRAKRYNSYLRVVGQHRGWDGFLFWK